MGEQYWTISKNCSDYLGLPSQCSIICQISFYQESNNEQNIAFPIPPALNFYLQVLAWNLIVKQWHKEIEIFASLTITAIQYTLSVFMFWDYCFLNMLIMLPALTESCSSRVQEPCKQGTVKRGNIEKERQFNPFILLFER